VTGQTGATGPTGATGTTGPGNTVNAAYQTGAATNTTETYSTTNAPKITVNGSHTVLVTLSFSATTTGGNSGCMVSFSGDNGSTINTLPIATLSDARGAGGNGTPDAGSRAELAVTKPGTTTFQMGYRRTGPASGTCTFTNMSTITQVY
jgi:hypothetical protein